MEAGELKACTPGTSLLSLSSQSFIDFLEVLHALHLGPQPGCLRSQRVWTNGQVSRVAHSQFGLGATEPGFEGQCCHFAEEQLCSKYLSSLGVIKCYMPTLIELNKMIKDSTSKCLLGTWCEFRM